MGQRIFFHFNYTHTTKTDKLPVIKNGGHTCKYALLIARARGQLSFFNEGRISSGQLETCQLIETAQSFLTCQAAPVIFLGDQMTFYDTRSTN